MLKNWMAVLLGTSLVLFSGFILVASNALAQEVSVTDYQVPVSTADRLLIDFSMNHVMTGSTATTSQGNIGGTYKKFYDSLPFGYSIDVIGSGLVDKSAETDAYETNYQINGDASIKKYLMENHPLLKDSFGSLRIGSDMNRVYDRPTSAVTAGLGYGRFIEATALAKAVRIEEFLIYEGEISDHLPKDTMLELSKIINREEEYKDKFGETYKRDWYNDMEAVINESGLLIEGNLSAIGVLRIEEILERENIADRFYGWDVTVGSKFDITTPYTDQERPIANLNVTASYARPIAWRWQISERISMDTPFDSFGSAYALSLSSDISYELSNRIDFRLRHLFKLANPEGRNVENSQSLGLAFIYYIENNMNLVVTEQIEIVPDEDITSNFSVVLNYRFF